MLPDFFLVVINPCPFYLNFNHLSKNRSITKHMKKIVYLLIFLFSSVTLGFSQQKEDLKPVVTKPIYFDVSPPLRDMVNQLHKKTDNTWKEGVIENYTSPHGGSAQYPSIAGFRDPVLQDNFGSVLTDTSIVNFDGLGAGGSVPPDTYGEVGPNHYFEVTNCSYAIYNKTGSKIFGPMANSGIWFGMPNNSNGGDGVVAYDEESDRWLFAQLSYPSGSGTPPFFVMIAVSQTPDPTGSWYRWEYTYTQFPDYEKFGVWPDGYYMSFNGFSGGYSGPGASAFDRTAMLAGDPNARCITFYPSTPDGFASMLPSDCDGTFPPAGTPNYFTYIATDSPQHLGIYEFHADWTNTANSTFGNPTQLTVTPFTTMNGGVPQLGSSRFLEVLGDRLMYRLQYRKFNGYSAMVLNHSVNTGSGVCGVRWYQLKNTGSGWTIYQQSTYAPADNNSRWMGSISMDTAESIALGYSVSGTTIHPQIRYTGRYKTDALNTMTIAEKHIIDGAGSQTGSWSGRSRWGDYSAMSVDPSSPTTFWYAQEYYATTSDGNWQTRIASFTFGNVYSVIVTASPPVVCSGTSSQLEALAYGGSGNYTYSWTSNPPGFTSNIKNPVVTLTVTTQYMAVVSDGSQTKHDTVKVTVINQVTAFAGNDTTVCKQAGIFTNHAIATNYRLVAWGSSGDGAFSSPDSVVTDYIPGNHDKTIGGVDLYFEAMPIAPCTGIAHSAKHVILDDCTGIPVTVDEAFKVFIYPNPAEGNFRVTIEGLQNQIATITFTDVHGRTIFQENATGVKTFARKMDVTGYAKGIYFLKVQTNDRLTTEKVIVQ